MCLRTIRLDTQLPSANAPVWYNESHGLMSTMNDSLGRWIFRSLTRNGKQIDLLCPLPSSQVYQVDKDSYRRLTKHYGKSIADYNTLLFTIQEFFHDGNSIRKGILSKFIQSLKTLISVIKSEEGCRFFGCSLLILYEGELSHQLKVPPQVEKCPGVGNPRPPSPVPSSNHQLLACSERSQRIRSENSCREGKKVEDSNQNFPQKRPRLNYSSIPKSVNELEVPLACSTFNATSPSSVADVVLKVIDFPHVVYQNELTSTSYEGPDKDFLFGLNNLLEILEKILVNVWFLHVKSNKKYYVTYFIEAPWLNHSKKLCPFP